MQKVDKSSKVDSFQTFLDRLEAELRQLVWPRQLAFGTACCERAFPNYVAFSCEVEWGDPAILRESLDKAWRFVEGEPFVEDEIRELKQRCDTATPDADDFQSVLVGPGQEAGFCIHLLLDFCVERNPKRVVGISTWAMDTIDNYVQDLENIEITDPAREERIENHPLMQRELERQRSDLAYLKEPDADLVEFRRRATNVTESNIGLS